MTKGMRRGLLWAGLAAAAFGLVALTMADRAGAQDTKMRLTAPSGDVKVGDAPFRVDAVIEDVANLGAFQFNVIYDSSILNFVGVQQGPFLASSGRTVQCLDPRINPGSIRFVCLTLGAMPPGADGSGVLATLTFAPGAPGASALRLQDAMITSPDGQVIPATTEDASVSVTLPGAPETPSPAGTLPSPTVANVTPVTTPPASTPAKATPTGASSVRLTPTPLATPATTQDSGGGTNWPLWGSVIGAAALLLAAAAGLFLWSRSRTPP